MNTKVKSNCQTREREKNNNIVKGFLAFDWKINEFSLYLQLEKICFGRC